MARDDFHEISLVPPKRKVVPADFDLKGVAERGPAQEPNSGSWQQSHFAESGRFVALGGEAAYFGFRSDREVRQALDWTHEVSEPVFRAVTRLQLFQR